MKREERKVLRPSLGVGSWSKFVVGSSFGPNLLVEKNSFGDLLRSHSSCRSFLYSSFHLLNLVKPSWSWEESGEEVFVTIQASLHGFLLARVIM